MRIMDWLEDRTGLVSALRGQCSSGRSGPASRTVWISVLLFLLLVEVVTGVALMTVYSPSSTTAWSSVWYIQTQVPYGWLVRGVHHFASDALIVIAGLYLLGVVLRRAYRPPHDFVWFLSIGILAMIFGAALTGYLLPWDQNALASTRVRTNILALTPIIGPSLRQLLLGGAEFGNLSLARFYTLHVAVLPLCLAGAFFLRSRAVHRHGESMVRNCEVSSHFSPFGCSARIMTCAIVLAVVVGFVCYQSLSLGDQFLAAPADPTNSSYPARPEWWALFLFQWLKYFETPTAEMVGAIVVPGAMGALVLLIPYWHRVLPNRLAHRIVLLFGLLAFASVGWLTLTALRADQVPPDVDLAILRAKEKDGETLTSHEQRALRAARFHRDRERAGRLGRRSIELANEKGIPPEGPLALLTGDAVTRGPELFAQHCASCHRHFGSDGMGEKPAEPATSSDLGGFASRSWIRGLLKNPMDDRYFGRMVDDDGKPMHTRMRKWIESTLEDVESDEDQLKLDADFDAVAAYLEDESIHPGRLALENSDANKIELNDKSIDENAIDSHQRLIARGRKVFVSVCNECHSYRGERTGTFNAPEMFGYGSVDWLELMIANPAHESRYRSRGRGRARMPAFEEKIPHDEISLLAQWLHDARDDSTK